MCFASAIPLKSKAVVWLLLNRQSRGWQRRRGVVNKSRTFSLINILCTCVVFFSSPELKAVNGLLSTCLCWLFLLYTFKLSLQQLTRKRRHNEPSIYALLPDTLDFLPSHCFQGLPFSNYQLIHYNEFTCL